jgi:hypothetical protein
MKDGRRGLLHRDGRRAFSAPRGAPGGNRAAILTIATGSGGVAIVVGTSGYAGTKVAE